MALDPEATLAPTATELVVDSLGMIAGWGGRAREGGGGVEARTSDPERRFTITLGPEHVALEQSLDGDRPDLVLPAEAFVRLVYGRLDADHAPAVEGDADLDELRATFPGV